MVTSVTHLYKKDIINMYFGFLIFCYYLICYYFLFRVITWINRVLPHTVKELAREKHMRLIERRKRTLSGKKLIILIAVWFVIVSINMIAFFMPVGNKAEIYFHNFANTIFGATLIMLFVIIIIDLLRLVIRIALRKEKRYKAILNNQRFIWGCAIVTFVLGVIGSVYGLIHAHYIKDTYYDVTVYKNVELKETVSGKTDELKIVLVADQHLGTIIGADDIENMVEHINAMEPDLVCFAGDFFDNHFEDIDDPDRIIAAMNTITAPYGCYACMGNHDVDERLLSGFSAYSYTRALQDPRFVKFLEDCGVTVLQDEAYLIDDSFYLIGQKDYEKPGDGTKNRASIEDLTEYLDQSLPIIDVNHEPRELMRTANAGVDLHLSGHTHNGQFLPLSLGINLVWENPFGVKEITPGRYSIVTSGVGVYGPAFRIGTDAEVVCITVHFKSAGTEINN